MFIFKYLKSIFSFGLKFFILILGILSKIVLSEVLLLESDGIDNLKDQELSSDQTLFEKFKNLPWGLIFYVTLLAVFAYYSYPEGSLYPDDSSMKDFVARLLSEYSITKDDFAAAPDKFKFYFFLEKEAKYWAFKQGLVEGSPECKEFINKFIRDHCQKFPESIRSSIESLLT